MAQSLYSFHDMAVIRRKNEEKNPRRRKEMSATTHDHKRQMCHRNAYLPLMIRSRLVPASVVAIAEVYCAFWLI